MAFFKIYVTCSRREPDIDSHLKFTRKCGFKSDDRNSLTIHLVVSDSCGHIFLFSKNDEKMCHLLHFLLHLKIKLDTILKSLFFLKKNETWYFIPNCSKWFMCIFMRFEIQTTFEFQGIYWNKVYHFSHRGLLLNLMAFHTQNSCLT